MKLTLEQTFIAELIADGTSVPQVRAILPDGSFFEDLLCSRYYESMLSTFDKHSALDFVLIDDELKARKLSVLELISWNTRAAGYGDKVVIYAKQIAEAYMKRVGGRIITNLNNDFEENPDPFEAIDSAVTTLMGIRSQFVKEHSVSMWTVAKETVEEVDKIHGGKDESLPFGFSDIDNITGGMRKGNFIVWAGLEKSGKSTAALQTIFHNAKRGTPCLFFSTEMTRVDLMLRYALIKEKLSWIKLIKRNFSTLELERLKKQIAELGKYPIYVSDKLVSILDVVAESQRMVADRGVKLIVADYIQNIIPTNKKNNANREQEVSNISKGLKGIAFSNKIVLIGLCQLTDDLRARESRAIGQDADKIITINDPDENEQTDDGNGAIVGIKIKQRFGAGGNFSDTKLIYDKIYGYWKSYLGNDEHEPPSQQKLIDEDPF